MDELLFIILLISLFFWQGGERELLLGVGVTVGLFGCKFITFSLELLLGEILAGKLRVLVQCDRLRTILIPSTFHQQSLDSLLLICNVHCWHFSSVSLRRLYALPPLPSRRKLFFIPFSFCTPSAFRWPFSHYYKHLKTAVAVDSAGWGWLTFLLLLVHSCGASLGLFVSLFCVWFVYRVCSNWIHYSFNDAMVFIVKHAPCLSLLIV